MNKEEVTKLLSVYCDSEHHKFKFIFPTIYAGKVWNSATDGHRFMMIEQTEENKIEDPPIQFPNLAAIIPEWNCYIPIKVSKLIDAYESIPIIKRPQTIDCYNCDGEGEFYREGYEYECKNCDGKGYLETGKTEEVKDPDVFLKINTSLYNCRFVRTIIDQFNQLETITLVSDGNFKVGVFKITDEIIVGLMPAVNYGDEETLKIVTV